MKKAGPHATRSCNANVNSPGRALGGKGSPKEMSLGKDLSRDATNVATVCGHNPGEYSPSATSQSGNK
jgi:hypothetical protein